MDKQTEIKTLKSLKSDSYFAEYFSSDDIDRMCENVKNDFPIEMNCDFRKEAQILKARMAEEKAKMKETMRQMCQDAIKAADDGDVIDQLIDNALVKYLPKVDLLKMKFDLGYEMTEENVNYLFSCIK